jgi:hypothetical protein
MLVSTKIHNLCTGLSQNVRGLSLGNKSGKIFLKDILLWLRVSGIKSK